MTMGIGIQPEINTVLMNSTFKIQGNNGKIGTAFVLGLPVSPGSSEARYVLITADHLLREIDGEWLMIELRKKVSDEYVKYPYKIQIRNNNQILWIKHPDEDIAVLYVALPRDTNITLESTDILATDEIIENYDIYPGRGLTVLGYPLGAEANDAGFPILRSARIAGFPLLPTKKTKTFLIDMQIFEGNSGGPVYFFDQNWHKRLSNGITVPSEIQIIMGLIVGQKVAEATESYEEPHQLGLAEVVHASLIKETIDLLKKK
jgi:hypothetical protein